MMNGDTSPLTYRLGGWSSVIFLVYSLLTILILTVLGPPPETMMEYYQMLNENRFVGLLRLDILTAFAVPLYYLLFFSIYQALRAKEGAVLAAILIFAGVTLFLAAPSVFSYLHLSERYAEAATVVEKERLLAAGEAILAADMWHGTPAIIGGILVQTGALWVSVLMLNGLAFRKWTAYSGIIVHGLDLSHLLIGLFSPGLGALIMQIAGPIYLLWFPLLAGDLFKLSRVNRQEGKAAT